MIGPDASLPEEIENGLIPVVRVIDESGGAETFDLRERMARYAVPGAAVVVIDDGGIRWSAAYGTCNSVSGHPLDGNSLMQAASISKAVAAVGVLALVEHGDLDLDDDVLDRLGRLGQLGDWRPAAVSPDLDHPITLRHLLSHTAGLTVPGFPGYRTGEPLPTIADIVRGTGSANTPAIERFAAPGTTMRYSGGGTTLVHWLVTAVTGRPFDELMDDLVLGPFGMDDSCYRQPLPTSLGGRAAVGHDATGQPVLGGHHVYPELQAAGLWTTADDLARWSIAVQEILRGERQSPISQQMAEMMVTAVQPGTFGLGPELGGESTDAGDLRRFGHSGSNEGFRSLTDALVARPQGVVVLTNGAGGTALCGEIRRSVAASQGWGPVDEMVVDSVPVDAERLQMFTGRWVGPFGLPLRLELVDGNLSIPAPYGRRRLIPVGGASFVDEETGAMVRVEVDGDGDDRIAVLAGGVEIMEFSREDPSS